MSPTGLVSSKRRASRTLCLSPVVVGVGCGLVLMRVRHVRHHRAHQPCLHSRTLSLSSLSSSCLNRMLRVVRLVVVCAHSSSDATNCNERRLDHVSLCSFTHGQHPTQLQPPQHQHNQQQQQQQQQDQDVLLDAVNSLASEETKDRHQLLMEMKKQFDKLCMEQDTQHQMVQLLQQQKATLRMLEGAELTGRQSLSSAEQMQREFLDQQFQQLKDIIQLRHENNDRNGNGNPSSNKSSFAAKLKQPQDMMVEDDEPADSPLRGKLRRKKTAAGGGTTTTTTDTFTSQPQQHAPHCNTSSPCNCLSSAQQHQAQQAQGSSKFNSGSPAPADGMTFPPVDCCVHVDAQRQYQQSPTSGHTAPPLPQQPLPARTGRRMARKVHGHRSKTLDSHMGKKKALMLASDCSSSQAAGQDNEPSSAKQIYTHHPPHQHHGMDSSLHNQKTGHYHPAAHHHGPAGSHFGRSSSARPVRGGPLNKSIEFCKDSQKFTNAAPPITPAPSIKRPAPQLQQSTDSLSLSLRSGGCMANSVAGNSTTNHTTTEFPTCSSPLLRSSASFSGWNDDNNQEEAADDLYLSPIHTKGNEGALGAAPPEPAPVSPLGGLFSAPTAHPALLFPAELPSPSKSNCKPALLPLPCPTIPLPSQGLASQASPSRLVPFA
eukprot:TRINITY_DN65647_c8_g7_i1.p1 TRINITY_DN65647_c8_g7~~TRINITY_DN65647_c8_g7_i1.p1  ORF type:complete len:656 (-),score=105.53 TRINITY_DN65647_c8_g7_i1:73-2040(-)